MVPQRHSIEAGRTFAATIAVLMWVQRTIARKVGDEKGASETSAATFVQDHAAMKMTKEMELMSHVISTLIRGAVGGTVYRIYLGVVGVTVGYTRLSVAGCVYDLTALIFSLQWKAWECIRNCTNDDACIAEQLLFERLVQCAANRFRSPPSKLAAWVHQPPHFQKIALFSLLALPVVLERFARPLSHSDI